MAAVLGKMEQAAEVVIRGQEPCKAKNGEAPEAAPPTKTPAASLPHHRRSKRFLPLAARLFFLRLGLALIDPGSYLLSVAVLLLVGTWRRATMGAPRRVASWSNASINQHRC